MRRKQRKNTEKGWEEQFLLSLEKWTEFSDDRKDEFDQGFFTGPLDRQFESMEPVGEPSVSQMLIPSTLRALLHQEVTRSLSTLEVALSKCESPIEVPMLFALTIVGRELGASCILLVDDREYGDREDSAGTVWIQPQARLGEHRVDFLVTYGEVAPDFSRPIKLPDGREIPDSKEITKKMVIECDGHDFHDRTKEQARKDRGRDRMLQSLGYRVYRYTGSEIWADVFICAHEAISGLIRQAHEEV